MNLEDAGALCRSHRPGDEFALEPMIGGASTRRYFRVNYTSGHSAVLMYVPEGAKAEEIDKEGPRSRQRWPFLEVRALLQDHAVRVPEIYAEGTDLGWLLLEDLGDDTLANYLLKEPEQKTALYRQAVGDLARAQKKLAALPAESIVGRRRFDEDLLVWEIDHFREWGVEAQGHTFEAEDRRQFAEIATRLARRIAQMPYGFTHRDYQSRNLMVYRDSLVWIDFQDSLLGPRVYDLVALLNDSYQAFERRFVEERLGEFAAAIGLPASRQAEVVQEFDLVTVQRKLKDAGRFVFIDRVKNNPNFLKFVAPTIAKVRSTLTRLKDTDADMHALDAILQRSLGDKYGA